MWSDDPPEDRVISIFAGCLANRAHNRETFLSCDHVSVFVPNLHRSVLLSCFSVTCQDDVESVILLTWRGHNDMVSCGSGKTKQKFFKTDRPVMW